MIVEITEKGNKSTSPDVILTTVNEDFQEIEVFSVDAGTEFLWAVAAVVGCFSMILIPSFTVYFAARAKERKNELKLEQAEQQVDESIDSTTQKDRCSCNSKEYVIWAHNEFFNVTRDLRIDL